MPITPLTLYFFLLVLVLLYLILIQYTKFFTLPIFGYKMCLNLHFYLVLLYILCFFLCTIFALGDWYFHILAEIFLHQGEILSKDLDSFSLENKTVEAVKTQKTENIVVSCPKEQKQWWFVQSLQKYYGNIALNKMETVHSSPSNPATLEAGQALYKGLSPAHSHPSFQGFFTPEALGIADLNSPNTQVPYFKRTHTLENGKEINMVCFNGCAGFNPSKEMLWASQVKPNISGFQEFCLKHFMRFQGFYKTQCVLTKTLTQAELTDLFFEKNVAKPGSPTNRFNTTPGAD